MPCALSTCLLLLTIERVRRNTRDCTRHHRWYNTPAGRFCVASPLAQSFDFAVETITRSEWMTITPGLAKSNLKPDQNQVPLPVMMRFCLTQPLRLVDFTCSGVYCTKHGKFRRKEKPCMLRCTRPGVAVPCQSADEQIASFVKRGRPRLSAGKSERMLSWPYVSIPSVSPHTYDETIRRICQAALQ